MSFEKNDSRKKITLRPNACFRGEGFTLLEIIIALFVFFVGIVGIFSLLASNIQSSKKSVNAFRAGQLAQEGVELVRNIRDKNWLFLQDWKTELLSCASGCEMDYNDLSLSVWQNQSLKIDSDGLYNYETGAATSFKRKITIREIGDILQIKVEILWDNDSYVVIDNLTDWYNQ